MPAVDRFREGIRAHVESFLAERGYEGWPLAERYAYAVGFREAADLFVTAYIAKSLGEMAHVHRKNLDVSGVEATGP